MRLISLALAMVLSQTALAQNNAALVDVTLDDMVETGRQCQENLLEAFPRFIQEGIFPYARNAGEHRRQLIICLPEPRHWEIDGHPWVVKQKWLDKGVTCIASAEEVYDDRCEGLVFP